MMSEKGGSIKNYLVKQDLKEIPYLIMAVDCFGVNKRRLTMEKFEEEYELAKSRGEDFEYLSVTTDGLRDAISGCLFNRDITTLEEQLGHLIHVLPAEASGWIESTFGDLAQYVLNKERSSH